MTYKPKHRDWTGLSEPERVGRNADAVRYACATVKLDPLVTAWVELDQGLRQRVGGSTPMLRG